MVKSLVTSTIKYIPKILLKSNLILHRILRLLLVGSMMIFDTWPGKRIMHWWAWNLDPVIYPFQVKWNNKPPLASPKKWCPSLKRMYCVLCQHLNVKCRSYNNNPLHNFTKFVIYSNPTGYSPNQLFTKNIFVIQSYINESVHFFESLLELPSGISYNRFQRVSCNITSKPMNIKTLYIDVMPNHL